MSDTDFDFSKRYRIGGWGGIVWYCTGYEKTTNVEPVYDEDGEYTGYDDWEEVENHDRVVCIMVGDDSKHTFDVDELTEIADEDYCHECGQIGCTADGR